MRGRGEGYFGLSVSFIFCICLKKAVDWVGHFNSQRSHLIAVFHLDFTVEKARGQTKEIHCNLLPASPSHQNFRFLDINLVARLGNGNLGITSFLKCEV